MEQVKWDECRRRYNRRWPRFSTDFEGLIDGLRRLEDATSATVLSVQLRDGYLGRRTWLGQVSATELTAMLAEARGYTIEVTYEDGSVAHVSNARHPNYRQIWHTAGMAQDAVHECFRVQQRIGLLRHGYVALPGLVASIGAIVAMAFAVEFVPDRGISALIGFLSAAFLALSAVLWHQGDGGAIGARRRGRDLRRRGHSGARRPSALAGKVVFPTIDGSDVVMGFLVALSVVLVEHWIFGN
ncbi:hypothetical protein [Kribbella endophytica]